MLHIHNFYSLKLHLRDKTNFWKSGEIYIILFFCSCCCPVTDFCLFVFFITLSHFDTLYIWTNGNKSHGKKKGCDMDNKLTMCCRHHFLTPASRKLFIKPERFNLLWVLTVCMGSTYQDWTKGRTKIKK